MGKVFSLLWVLVLTACATPTAVPTAELQPTATDLPAPTGGLTLVEFFAVS